MKAFVRYLLEQRRGLPLQHWTAQGFGFLRLKINDSLRIHVWDQRLRIAGASDIHDHTQWAFTSHVLSGSLVNIRYTVYDANGVPPPEAQPYHMSVLKCGIGGGMVHDGTENVLLIAGKPEHYLPGSTYRQEPDEIHRTIPQDGTVTVIEQERRDVDTARVFWPFGGAWGDAIPRQAEQWEVDQVVECALKIWRT